MFLLSLEPKYPPRMVFITSAANLSSELGLKSAVCSTVTTDCTAASLLTKLTVLVAGLVTAAGINGVKLGFLPQAPKYLTAWVLASSGVISPTTMRYVLLGK